MRQHLLTFVFLYRYLTAAVAGVRNCVSVFLSWTHLGLFFPLNYASS